MFDLQALSGSFPHIVDSIILFSDDETQRTLRLTSRFLRQHVDLTLHRALRGSVWYIENASGVFVRGLDIDSIRRVVSRWDEHPHFPGLKAAKAVFFCDTPADTAEQVASQVSPDVVPYVCHFSSPAHYPLSNASRAVLEVSLLDCHCDDDRPEYDYGLNTPDVLVTLWWQGAGWYDPVTGVPTPGLPMGVFYPPGKEPRITSPTTCRLLKQVLHPNLKTLRLLCPLVLLRPETPSFIFPKLSADLTLPDDFKMTIEINSLEDTESEEARGARKAFATYLGVTEAQVEIEREGKQTRPSWWPPVYSVFV
ncbi:hypothetical protein A1Q1_03793 [Trichosporon asahii var. asahii CBS 2479]|uniref:Uncharacterized protein n=1 Tax=Trichosporon asahii var. asahii (strain ATCC 90039 / CBS 2479 / JCM 2466 / KCTC 7840 / NBRC 103889/ NCYC 2677 / UAMH 7654) TaxID=1186058 RepID=J6FBL9_TRIAS|nr:hypothetical protein A1Q1_03793 [Trichosporon asahii var. asahii CBS 2479]EJT52512.1 hypothetical protein A1Q1_03793 [Trichosporon asahii var. asahii CBS 2479]